MAVARSQTNAVAARWAFSASSSTMATRPKSSVTMPAASSACSTRLTVWRESPASCPSSSWVRFSLRVLRQNIAWAVAYNLVCVPMALAGWLPPWAAGLGMASSSMLVIANSLRLSR